MAELDLPRGPRELLEAVRKPLAHHLGGEQHIRVGGGTALAARWGHRHSTDVDLFVDPDRYMELYRNSQRFSTAVERHTANAEHVGVGLGYTLIMLPEGEVTVVGTPFLTSQGVSGDTVRGTGISLETNAEILAKKLAHRVALYHIFVPRDLYDIAAARRLDPEALETALATIPPASLHDIRKHLDLLPPDWPKGHRQPLLEAAHARDAADSVAIVQRLIKRHLVRRTPPSQPRDTPPHPSR